MTDGRVFGVDALASLWGIRVDAATGARVDAAVRELLGRAWPAIAAVAGGDAHFGAAQEAPVSVRRT